MRSRSLTITSTTLDLKVPTFQSKFSKRQGYDILVLVLANMMLLRYNDPLNLFSSNMKTRESWRAYILEPALQV